MPRFVTSASRTSVLLVVIAAAAAALPPAHAWAFVVPSVPSTAISSRQSLNSRHADMSKLSSCNRQISTMPVQPVRRDCTGTMTRGLCRTSCSMTATPNASDGSSDATGSKGVEVELEEDKEAMVHVSLPKPLGVQFEEIRAGFPGLMVSTILEGGSAIEDGVSFVNTHCNPQIRRYPLFGVCTFTLQMTCVHSHPNTVTKQKPCSGAHGSSIYADDAARLRCRAMDFDHLSVAWT